jgi:alkanesulfonate monooxygenase SsuD/methylene tetrahydromethanopterin reductase-like flavin-dependent oxidoreductase (luciferase family)
MSTQRLGLTVIPGAGWRASDVRNVAREAEAAGFDAIFTTEVNNDALATRSGLTPAGCGPRLSWP